MDRDRFKKPSSITAAEQPTAAAAATSSPTPTANGSATDGSTDEPSNKFNYTSTNNKNGINDDKNINQCEISDRQSLENNTDCSMLSDQTTNQNNCSMLSDEHSPISSSHCQSSSGVYSNNSASSSSINGINGGVNNINHYSRTSIGSSSNDSDIDKDKSSNIDKYVASTVATTAHVPIKTATDTATSDNDININSTTTVTNHFNQSQINDNNSESSQIAQSINGGQRKCVISVDSSESNDNSAINTRIKANKCQEQNLNGGGKSETVNEKNFKRMSNSIDKTKSANDVGTTVIATDANKTINDFYTDDDGSKRVLYNEYVNLLSDADLSGMAAKQRKISKNADAFGAKGENKPLLCGDDHAPIIAQTNKSNQKPKSIVKSPSSQTFNGSTADASKLYEMNRKPRLSIQCTGSDPERPVLHVQFLSQRNQCHRDDDGDDDDPTLSKSYPPQTMNSRYQNGRYPGDKDDDNNNNGRDINEYSDIGANRPRGSILSTPSTSTTSSSDSSDSSSSSDEESSIGQFIEAKPPDGGWGWVVVFASFMVNLIADGITFSFGVIFVEFRESFKESNAKTAWIGSVFMAMPLLSGPIASFLTDRYGCRKVTVVGSILASMGFVISSFTESMEMLFLTFGVISGFGLSLCYVAAVVIVAYYFDKRRSFATGLSVCGSGIGTFLFAPLTQALLNWYGWRGTTLVLAGIMLNMTVCGILMRDLEWTTHRAKLKAKQQKYKNQLRVSADSFSVSNSTNTGGTTSNLQKDELATTDFERSDGNGETSLANQSDIQLDDPRLFSSLINLPTFVKNGEKVPMEVLELLSTNRNIHNVLLRNYPGLAHSRSFSQPLTSSRQSNTAGLTFENTLENATSPNSNLPERQHISKKSRRIRNEQAFLAWLKENGNAQTPNNVRLMLHRHHSHHPTTAYLNDLRMHRHSLTYRGAMLNINRYRLRASSCPDIYRNSMTTIAKEKSSFRQGMDEFKSVLLDMLDISFFRDIRFALFALSNFLLYTWYDVPYVYLPDNAIEIGFDQTDASMLISIIGIINMFGEIILGWLGDRKWISAGFIYGICMLFCGVVTGLVPLLKTYIALSAVSGLFGLFIAANYALTSIILVELITLDRFTNAYGLLLLVQGIGNLVGPPLAGWISDQTGNYNLAFYLSGFFIILSGILMMILPARGKIRKYRAIRRKNSRGQDDEDEDDNEEESEECDEDAERRLTEQKVKQHQTIMAPKSALKVNGTTKNYFIGKNLLNNNDSTKINQV